MLSFHLVYLPQIYLPFFNATNPERGQVRCVHQPNDQVI